jgi:3-phosphoglycerate kinase
MNMKLRAAGYTAGVISLVFGSISLLTYIAKEQSTFILAGGLLAYMVYLMYRIKLGELEFEQQEYQRAEDIVKAKQKLADLEQSK